MIPGEFRQSLAEERIEPTDHQMNQFAIYYRTLVEWNEKMNLAAITDGEDVYLKYFYDSPTLAFEIGFTQPLPLCDAGLGAGFSSIPLRVAFPKLQVMIVNSLNKWITFLFELTRLLGTNAFSYYDRTETSGRDPHFHASSDLVTARAVTCLNVLAELCLPPARQEGCFYALKATKSEEESIEAKQTIALLGGKSLKGEAVTLPSVSDQRHIIIIQKKRPTPKKYPRKSGLPNKQPTE